MDGRSLIIAGALATLLAGAASAGERLEQSGREAFSTDVWEMLELGEGHAVALWRGHGIAYSDSPESPLHLATIDCAGAFEFMPDGTQRDRGHCTYTTRDGDKLFDRWWRSPDMEAARYEWIGGTGRWAGATGGGTYSVTQLDDRLLSVSYSGTLVLP